MTDAPGGAERIHTERLQRIPITATLLARVAALADSEA